MYSNSKSKDQYVFAINVEQDELKTRFLTKLIMNDSVIATTNHNLFFIPEYINRHNDKNFTCGITLYMNNNTHEMIIGPIFDQLRYYLPGKTIDFHINKTVNLQTLYDSIGKEFQLQKEINCPFFTTEFHYSFSQDYIQYITAINYGRFYQENYKEDFSDAIKKMIKFQYFIENNQKNKKELPIITSILSYQGEVTLEKIDNWEQRPARRSFNSNYFTKIKSIINKVDYKKLINEILYLDVDTKIIKLLDMINRIKTTVYKPITINCDIFQLYIEPNQSKNRHSQYNISNLEPTRFDIANYIGVTDYGADRIGIINRRKDLVYYNLRTLIIYLNHIGKYGKLHKIMEKHILQNL